MSLNNDPAHLPGTEASPNPKPTQHGGPTITTDALREVVLPRLERIKKSGAGFMAQCPSHQDGTASLSVSAGRDQPVVMFCHAGCQPDDILNKLGLTWADLSNPKPARDNRNQDDNWIACGWDTDTKRYDRRHRKTAEYLYRDQHGATIFATARCVLKGNGCQGGFRQWRPDPTKKGGRRWSRTLDNGTKAGEGLPYRLPEALAAIKTGKNIFVVEGEKDCDRLAQHGIAAVCNAEGAGKWTPTHAAWLTGADIIIVADRDNPGWRHAEHVANTLLDTARSIEIVRAATGKDTTDHLDAGHRIDQLVTIAEPLPAPLDCGHPACPHCPTEAATHAAT